MRISKDFASPFADDISSPLRLQYVPRWSIISMDRKQSVAEHSFNVARIVGMLYDAGVVSSSNRFADVVCALESDDDKTMTGDIPSPAKVTRSNGTPPIVKLADLVEAHRYVVLHCNDRVDVRKWVLNRLYGDIQAIISSLNITNYEVIEKLMEGK